MGADELDYSSPLDSPALQPAVPAAPVAPPPSPRGEALRSSLLKKPLDAGALAGPPGYPSGNAPAAGPTTPPGYPSSNPPATPPGYPPPRTR